jgi:hypothetical protein
MASPPLVTYWHRQTAPLCLVLYALAAFFIALGWALRQEPALAVVLPIAGGVVALLGAAFHHLTTEDQGDHLSIRFGPLPLFRTTLRYEQIRSLELGRATSIGIHWTLGSSTWNLWGRDCLVIHYKHGGVFRLGSDDAENLARFIRMRMEEFREQPR